VSEAVWLRRGAAQVHLSLFPNIFSLLHLLITPPASYLLPSLLLLVAFPFTACCLSFYCLLLPTCCVPFSSLLPSLLLLVASCVLRIPYHVFCIIICVICVPYSASRVPYSVCRVFRIPYSVSRILYSHIRIMYNLSASRVFACRITHSVFRFRIPYSLPQGMYLPYYAFRIPIPYSVFRITCVA
jgi:hypothetical protein